MRELQSIADVIARDSSAAAERTVRRIVASTRRLRDYPRSGQEIPELRNEGIRQVISRNYRVFYRIEEDQVVIVGVRHGAMDLTFENFPHD